MILQQKVYKDIAKEGIIVTKVKDYIETANLLIYTKDGKTTDKILNKMMQGLYNNAIPIGKYPLLVVKTPKDFNVYYLDKDLQICYITYDFWLKSFLVTEKIKKKDIPSYIG